jgi:spore coat protein U-like protein
MIIKIVRLIIVSLWVMNTATMAGTATGTMRVTTTVESSCSLGAGAAINLGSHDPDNKAATTAKTGPSLNVTCNSGANWKMFSTQSLTKAMTENTLTASTNSKNKTPSALFADAAMGLPLHPAKPSSVFTGIGTGAPQAVLIYTKAESGLHVYSGTHPKIIDLTLVY